MPPGLGDQFLDVLRFLKRGGEFLVVATPSKLSINVVEKLLTLLGGEREHRVIGIVENMKLDDEKDIEALAKRFNVPPYLAGSRFTWTSMKRWAIPGSC